jgi:radical SAM protein with 4Fe4S-binding SPASM domain
MHSGPRPWQCKPGAGLCRFSKQGTYMFISETAIPKKHGDLIVKRGPTNSVVISVATGNACFANRTALRILELVDGARTIQDIASVLEREHRSTNQTRVMQAVMGFVTAAVARNILTLGLCEAISLVRGPIDTHAHPVDTARATQPLVYWYPSFRCNLKCVHCSVEAAPDSVEESVLGTDACMRVVDQLAEAEAGVILSGGEFLLRRDALSILAALGRKGVPAGLETNGLLIGDDFVTLALDLQAEGLLRIAISLDGGTAEAHERIRGPHTFGRLMTVLRTMKRRGVRFDLNCVVSARNGNTVAQLYDIVRELSPACESLTLSALTPSGRGAEECRTASLRRSELAQVFADVERCRHLFQGVTLVKFPPALVPPEHVVTVFRDKHTGCTTSCAFPLLGILPDGDITICAMSRNDERLRMGSVNTGTLAEAWREGRLEDIRRRYLGAEELEGICGDCVWKRACRGSCRVRAMQDSGGFFAAFPACRDAAERGEFPDEYRLSTQPLR